MTTEVALRCGACGAPLADGDRFCERCGTRTGAPPEQSEGAGELAAGDRVELDRDFVAAVSDRGRVHRRNEDAFALRALGERQAAVVVCDGISSAAAGDLAARCAAEAACDVLAGALGGAADGREAVVAAVDAASRAVGAVPRTGRIDRAMPSCTLVAALCRDADFAVAWVGDSRAYWIAGNEARQITVDDSWAGEQVAERRLTPTEAMRDPRAHAVTRWIGADAPDEPPNVVELQADAPGHLLLCTDGLWNYAVAPGELARLVRALPDTAAPAAIARSLTDTALARGGHDNVTVAVVEIRPPREDTR